MGRSRFFRIVPLPRGAIPMAELSLFQDSGDDALLPAEAARRKRKPRVAVKVTPCDCAGDEIVTGLFAPMHAPAVFVPRPRRMIAENLFGREPPMSAHPEKDRNRSGQFPRFVPADWQLRPDSGDFLNIRTGEVRDEDPFDASDSNSVDAPENANEWDIPQDSGDWN